MSFEKKLRIEIGLRLRQTRVEAGLTQEGLAKMIGVKRSAISKYETGMISPSIETAARIIIATKHGISADVLEEIFND